MRVAEIVALVTLSCVFLRIVDGQLDGTENWHLSYILCDTLRFHDVYRVMRLDVNCYRHIGMFGSALCVEVIIKVLKIENWLKCFRTLLI